MNLLLFSNFRKITLSIRTSMSFCSFASTPEHLECVKNSQMNWGKVEFQNGANLNIPMVQAESEMAKSARSAKPKAN